jgi:hypothetical protein
VIELGEVIPGSQHQRTVELSNLEADVISIRRIDADCGCTTSEISRTKIPPRRSVDLEVSTSAPDAPGSFARKIIVSYDRGPVQLVVLNGICRVWVRSNPAVVRLDNVSQPTIKLTVETQTPYRLKQDLIEIGIPHAQVDVSEGEPMFRGKGNLVGHAYELTVNWQPPSSLVGNVFEGEIILRSEPHGLEHSIVCFAKQSPKVVVEPPSVYFGIVQPRDINTRVISLEILADALQFVEVTPPDDTSFTATSQFESGRKRGKIQVEFKTDTKGIAHRGEITVRLSDGSCVNIPVAGLMQESGK